MRNILIVGDLDTSLSDIQNTLIELKYRITSILRQKEEILSFLLNNEVDLILMNIVLDKNQGDVEIANKIKADFQVPIVYLLPSDKREILDKMDIKSSYTYVVEPFRKKDLKRSIEIVLDIHSLKRKLNNSESNLNLILENSNDIIATVDANKRILHFNRVPQNINQSESSLKGFIGKKIDELLYPLEPGEFNFEKSFFKALEKKKVEEIILKGTISTNVYHCKIVPSVNSENEDACILIFGDITGKLNIEKELRYSESKYQNLFLNSPVGMLTINDKGNIINLNNKLEQDLGYANNELINKKLSVLFPPNTDIIQHNNLMERFFKQPHLRKMLNRPRVISVKKKNGNCIPMDIVLNHYEDALGNIFAVALLNNLEDEDKVKIAQKALTEKELLLKEVHHRAKNNMQIISSLLSLESDKMLDEESKKLQTECQSRINAMAMVHEKFYKSSDLEKIYLNEYIDDLVQHLSTVYGFNKKNLINYQIDKVATVIDKAIPLGLIINEAIANSMKYAFGNSKKEDKNIFIQLYKINHDEIELTIKDNGPGTNINTLFNSDSMGMKLIKALVKQLKGKLNVNTDSGLELVIICEF